MKIFDQKGYNIVEFILALGIFLAFAASSGTILLRYFNSLQVTTMRSRVATQIEESIEAVRTIAATNWEGISNGTYGLSLTQSGWTLVGSPDTSNGVTRTIIVSSVLRDESCAIASSGDDDPDSKLTEVFLAFNSPFGNNTVSSSAYITRSDEPTFCMAEGDAAFLNLDVSLANIDATKKSLTGVTLTNAGTTQIILDKMTLTWDKPGLITYIKIEATNYWHSTSGIGTPQGKQPSGTELDLVNLTLEPGETYEVDAFRFDSKVDGSTFTITATLDDGSYKSEVTTPPFIP